MFVSVESVTIRQFTTPSHIASDMAWRSRLWTWIAVGGAAGLGTPMPSWMSHKAAERRSSRGMAWIRQISRVESQQVLIYGYVRLSD
jgi:hypothetical protein